VQDKEAQFCVVQLVDKGAAIHLVPPVGVCGRAFPNVVLDAAVADHQDACKRGVSRVGHDVDHGFL